MTYNVYRAIADFGFIEAYCRQNRLPGDEVCFEAFLDALECIEEYIRGGWLLSEDASQESMSRFLYDVGYIRGSIWNDKIPYLVSEALKNVVNFVTGCHDWYETMPEPKDSMLSDSERDALGNAAGEGDNLFHLVLEKKIDATEDAVVRYLGQEMGAMDEAESREWAEESRKEWESTNPTPTEPEITPPAPIAQLAEEEHEATAPETEDAPDEEYVLPEYHAIPRARFEWEPWQKETLMQMRADGAAWADVSEVIGRSIQKCRAMWHNENRKRITQAVDAPPPKPAMQTVEASDAIRDFLEKGGKITKLPTRYAEGSCH